MNPITLRPDQVLLLAFLILMAVAVVALVGYTRGLYDGAVEIGSRITALLLEQQREQMLNTTWNFPVVTP